MVRENIIADIEELEARILTIRDSL